MIRKLFIILLTLLARPVAAQRLTQSISSNWLFSKDSAAFDTSREPRALHWQPVSLPHTWNAKDGQDGGNDYWRGTCTYSTAFAAPAFDAASQEVWLQFEGVNSSAKVLLNGRNICTHDGGYSTFRVHVSDLLAKDNQLTVEVDNSTNAVFTATALAAIIGTLAMAIYAKTLHA